MENGSGGGYEGDGSNNDDDPISYPKSSKKDNNLDKKDNEPIDDNVNIWLKELENA